MEHPLVSIIIPVFNHEQALSQALASIARQTYRPLEVMIVDDGSTKNIDPSKYRYADIAVKLFRQFHRGAPAARNRGLQEAAGEYVIFWDADVIGASTMIERMLSALQEHPDVSYAYCNFFFGRKKMPARPFNGAELRQNNFIHSTALIRRSAVIPWDEGLKRFQDWDLWLTLLEQGKTGVWIPEYLFSVQPRRSGMSAWLPAFAYRAPWRFLPIFNTRVRRFLEAKAIVQKKHGIL